MSIDYSNVPLSAGVDPNMKNHDGLTALHQCCIDGSVDAVTLLIKYGADVNITDQDLWTPLHAAATCGHFKVVTALVKAGADVTAVNGDGDMPHDITEEEVTLQYLRNEIMKRNISAEDLEQIRCKPHNLLLSDVESVLAAGGDLDQPVGQTGETFLHVAIAEGYNDVVKLLLDKGARATVQDDDGWQPVHVAAYWSNEEALELLAINPKVNFRAETKDGDTPCELCEDPRLRLGVLNILRERHDSTLSSLTSDSGDWVKDIHSIHTEDTMDRSLSPTVNGGDSDIDDELLNPSVEDTPPSPLINIEATELQSDRRSSIKDVKHNAPLKRQTSERSSKRERESVTMEALAPLMLRRGSREKASLSPTIPSLSPDNYQELYETTQPTTQMDNAVKNQELSHKEDSDLDSVSQSHQHPINPTQPQSVTTVPTQSEGIVSPETAEDDLKTKDKDGGKDVNNGPKKGAMEELGDGLMLRPKKKKPAPPPPRGSLLDLKRQRSEERENRIQESNRTGREAAPTPIFYQGSRVSYEAPPSPSLIRYKYRMVPDNSVPHRIVRQRKCIVM